MAPLEALGGPPRRTQRRSRPVWACSLRLRREARKAMKSHRTLQTVEELRRKSADDAADERRVRQSEVAHAGANLKSATTKLESLREESRLAQASERARAQQGGATIGDLQRLAAHALGSKERERGLAAGVERARNALEEAALAERRALEHFVTLNADAKAVERLREQRELAARRTQELASEEEAADAWRPRES